MKKKGIAILIGIISLFTSVFAAWDLAWFIVNVDPSTVKSWEPTDLIVKAIDSDGNVVEDYEWDVVITVKDGDNELDNNDYVSPNDWVYTFTKQDMWKKVFTKGLIVNKEWNFKVRVEDFNTSKFGEWDIKVVSKNWEQTWKVEITTPQDSETVKTSTVTVAWNAKQYTNSKIQVFVDDKINSEWMVDSSWNYQLDLLNLSNWDHTIKVEVLNFEGKVVATSNSIKVNVDAKSELYKWVTISPEWKLNKGTKVIVTIKVDSSVTSATLHIANYGDYPMNRKSIDEFTTELTANILWKSDISLDVENNTLKKSFDKIAQLVVVEKIAIQEVKFKRDNNKNTIDLNWKFTWEVPAFKVLYGTEGSWKYNTGDDIIVNENKYTIKNIDNTKTYFVKIVPVDSNWTKIWDESNEVVIESNMQASATCNIDNIKTKLITEDLKNYITWDKVEWAVKYTIFEWKDKTNLNKIAELTWNKYQLPFDPEAKKTEYAYFTVKAVCDDGTMKQIDNVKKVKVWPMDWILYAILITFIIYGLRLAIREN